MKALVISGGGAKGAFAGGIAQYLIEDLHNEYDKFYGTSTGSLIIPFLAINELEKLKTAYTNVKQKDIFKINPFKITQNNKGNFKTSINIKNILRNILINRKLSFGDSSNLKKLIKKFISSDDYDKILKNNKELVCSVTNATLGEVEYKSSFECSYEDFVDWIYASSCAPPFMSVVQKDGYEYVDGATMEQISIQKAIDDGATEIDAIILKPEKGSYKIEKIRNILHFIIKLMDMMMLETSRNDMQIRMLRVRDGNVKLNVYRTPRRLTNNSLVFDKKIMTEWWNEGYECAKNDYRKTYDIVKKRKLKLIFNGTAEL